MSDEGRDVTEAEARDKAEALVSQFLSETCGEQEFTASERDRMVLLWSAALLATDTAAREAENMACEEIARNRMSALGESPDKGPWPACAEVIRDAIASRRKPTEGGERWAT